MTNIIFRAVYLLKEKLIQNFKDLSNYHHYKYYIESIKRRFQYLIPFKNYYKTIHYYIERSDIDIIHRKREIPKSAGIGITNVCNLNCIMCNIKLAKVPPGYMDPRIFEIILKELKKIRINSVAIHTIGEPLMHKDIDQLFQIIKKNKIKIKFSTNGQLPERLIKLIHYYSNQIEFVRFSIDAAKPKTYEFIRKGANFKKLIKSLELVHKFNQNRINFNVSVKIDSILSLTNINEIPLFFKKYGKYCKPESINFTLVNGLSPDTAYFKKAFPFPNLIKKEVPCSLPFNAVYFTNDGKVTLCCEDFNEELTVGNIKDNSLIKIWSNDYSSEIRRQHLSPETISITACKNCYGPYKFISNITNYFIHLLYYYHPEYSNKEFGDRLIYFLHKMDKTIKNKGLHRLEQVILNIFRKEIK
ncbi:MAG: radical SAM/SPASM domain-containing protein [Promethearchaeota archaeon]